MCCHKAASLVFLNSRETGMSKWQDLSFPFSLTHRIVPSQNLQVDFSIKSRVRRGRKNRLEPTAFQTMHFFTAFALALPAISFATAVPRDGGNCNTGPVQCCNQVQQVRGIENNKCCFDIYNSIGLERQPRTLKWPPWPRSRPYHWPHWL